MNIEFRIFGQSQSTIIQQLLDSKLSSFWDGTKVVTPIKVELLIWQRSLLRVRGIFIAIEGHPGLLSQVNDKIYNLLQYFKDYQVSSHLKYCSSLMQFKAILLIKRSSYCLCKMIQNQTPQLEMKMRTINDCLKIFQLLKHMKWEQNCHKWCIHLHETDTTRAYYTTSWHLISNWSLKYPSCIVYNTPCDDEEWKLLGIRATFDIDLVKALNGFCDNIQNCKLLFFRKRLEMIWHKNEDMEEIQETSTNLMPKSWCQ